MDTQTLTLYPSKPRVHAPDGILFHAMSRRIGGIAAEEFLASIGLSVHYTITPEGKLRRCVPINRIAYHAGRSQWGEQSGLNATFIGVELLVDGANSYSEFIRVIEDPSTFTDEHYTAAAELCVNLMTVYPAITPDRILRHSQVSGANVRPDPKPDPGAGWDMMRLFEIMGV